MKHPTIFSGLVIALLLTACIAVAGSGLTLILRPQFVLQVMIIAAVCGYGVALLMLAGRRVGRGLSLAFLLTGQLALFFAGASAILLIAAGLLQLWLVRSFFFAKGFVEWLGDGCVVIAGFVVATYMAQHGHGLTGAVWGFLLIQSLFVIVPQLKRIAFGAVFSDHKNVEALAKLSPFEVALKCAEDALARMPPR